ncbi:hypothetical protein A5699_24770 [Mycobacterium sp. E802]|nr:hypothetical protein A5699_24770 [Mycobacterium sp. E802]
MEDDYVAGAQDSDALGALDIFAPDDEEFCDDRDGLDGALYAGETLEDPVFTVTNPAGTISATAYFTGPVQRIDLDASVVRMTEHELAEEIQVIAELAQLKARSVAHTFLLEGMTRMGHDRSEWSSILNRDINLPSPDQADEKIAEVFATRYGHDEP